MESNQYVYTLTGKLIDYSFLYLSIETLKTLEEKEYLFICVVV